MDKYNQIADKIAENGYIATWCTENYARLMLLWLRRNDYHSAAKLLETDDEVSAEVC